MNVYEKLVAVQLSLKAPKSQYNAFGNYNYRNCEDIIEAAKPLLSAGRLLLTLTDDIVNIGERFYVKATATITDIDDKESISVTAFAREELTKKGMDGSQVTGASSSYARKYALNGIFAIDDTKDSDTTNTGSDNVKPNAPKKVETAPQKMDTVEEAAGYVLSFGKHKGKTLGELYKTERDYLIWLYDNEKTDPVIRKGIDILSQAVRNARK